MYRNDIYTCVYETKDGEIGYVRVSVSCKICS